MRTIAAAALAALLAAALLACTGDRDDATARDAASRFASRLADADYDSFHRRLWGHLRRRGYGAGVSRRAIARLWREREAAATGRD